MKEKEVSSQEKIPPEILKIIKKLKFCATETIISNNLLEGLSNLISVNAIELDSSIERGRIWLNRSNARKKGQEIFYVYFSPTTEERTKGISTDLQIILAEGNFLKKELIFFTLKEIPLLPPYVSEKFVPFLKEFFEKFGFEVVIC